MKIFITDEQKAELELLYHTCCDKRECDRIKAVLLAPEGWSSVMIAQALRLYETLTIIFLRKKRRGAVTAKVICSLGNSQILAFIVPINRNHCRHLNPFFTRLVPVI